MLWAKTPVVAGSSACAACLAITMALPSSAPLAEKATPTVVPGMTLTGIENLDLLNAIPFYLGLFSGDPATQQESLAGLDSLNGIAAFLNLGGQGLAAFEESDTSPGYAALSGLNSLTTGNLAGIDAFSALGATGLGDLDSVNGIPAFQQFLATGDLHSFDQT